MPHANAETAGRLHRLIEGLSDPRAYPHPVDVVERLETHISVILLAGDYAYKIKKPYDLGFLDFTTLAARRHYCEEELRLNRRLAASLYLDVVPLTGSLDAPRVGGTGPALEYAVRMRRFPQSALLSEQITHASVPLETMRAFGEALAAFHAGSATASAHDPWGRAEAIAEAARANFDQLAPRLRGTGARRTLAQLTEWTESALVRLAPVFTARKAAGRVRECHGDLHLGNLVLLDGAIQAFDCIEFNAAFRWIDVMSEVAFLVMDCASHGRTDLGFAFLNAYLESSGDYDGLQVLGFYLVFRALVRAKIAALRTTQTDAPGTVRRAAWRDCRHYLRLAWAAAHPPPPLLVLMHGLSGAGKSTVARGLAESLPAIHLRSDVERKRLFGLAPLARSDAALQARLYGPDASARTYARLQELARTTLQAGFSVIVDATFLKRAHRAPLLALWPRTLIVACTAPHAVLRQRVAARYAAGNDAAEADVRVLEAQIRSQEKLDEEERRHAVRIDTRAAPAPHRLAARLRRRASQA